MLTPLQYFKQFERDKREREKKNMEFFYTSTDSLITWIIGFCITSLTIIVANYSGIINNLQGSPKPIVALLLASILSGLSYRMLAYSFLVLDRRLDNYLTGVYGETDMTPIEADENVDQWKLDFVIEKLKSDFNVDSSPSHDPVVAELERQRLIAFYKEWCAYFKKEFDIAIRLNLDVNEVIYKIPKHRSERILQREALNPSMGYDLVLWTRLTNYSYWLTVLCFSIAVIWVSVFLLRQ